MAAIPTQSFDNYTITNVVYSVTGGTNVYTAHQTAVLTISPNVGYTVDANDFSWINTSLANVDTVVFTQSGENVTVTVTFDNPFTMPNAATTLSLCIAGAAQPSRNDVSGIYIAQGDATNLSIVSGCPVPQTINYTTTGQQNQEVLLLDKTYTVNSGYYFSEEFVVEYSGPNMVFENYNHIETKTFDNDGNHTSSNFKFYYTFPSETNQVIDDKIKLTVPNVKQIIVVQPKITNYTLDTSLLSPIGDGRIIRVFGVPNTTFTLASNNGSILSFETFNAAGTLLTYATTPTLTIPASGFFDINITIPASASVAQYCLTLAGGNLISPFPKPNPVCLNQYPDIDLTFNTTGTSNGQTFNVTGSPVVRSSVANFTPQVGSIPYKNDISWTVVAANGAAMTLVNNPTPSWTSFPDVITYNTSAVSNSTTIPVNSATGITTGMRVESNSSTFQLATTGNPPACTVTNVSGNNITVSPAVTIPSATNSSTTNQQMLRFTSQKGSKVDLPTSASLDVAGTTATVKVDPGIISRYGDGDVTYTLDLTSLLTIGSANQCKEWNVTTGANGGVLVYYDCVKKAKRQLTVFKGESDFSICALNTPTPTVTGTMSIAASGDICDNAGVDATCVTWSIVYNPASPRAKSVTVTYFDCVTLAENTITVAVGATGVTQCATRQTPVSSDPGDGGATITISNLTCTP